MRRERIIQLLGEIYKRVNYHRIFNFMWTVPLIQHLCAFFHEATWRSCTCTAHWAAVCSLTCSSGRCWGGAVRDHTPRLPPPVSFHTHCCSSLWSRWRPWPSVSLLWRSYCSLKTTTGEHKIKTLTKWSCDIRNKNTKLNPNHQKTYFIVRVIPAHRNGVHYVSAPLVFSGRAVWHIIWVMNSTKVVAKFMGCNQVRFLFVYG